MHCGACRSLVRPRGWSRIVFRRSQWARDLPRTEIAVLPPDEDHPYGHREAEPFAALLQQFGDEFSPPMLSKLIGVVAAKATKEDARAEVE